MHDHAFYKQNTQPELTQSDANVPLPNKIGPYPIEGLLNKGGMSLLYLGIDPQSKKPLTIKVLSPSYINHPEAVERFLQEAKVISLSNHPNIIKLYGQGKWEKGLYMAMEFIHGISLRQFIIQQSLSIRRALEIVLQVAYALAHLHSHGIIHRDLKPENILITEDAEIKVIDFGISQVHEEKKTNSSSSRFLGTPHYMSPEQKQDPTSVTFGSDIYSLGIILYELVLGKLSFGTIDLLSLPKGLRKIAEKSLAVSSKERYQTIGELIQDISLYLKSKELEKERPGKDQIREFNERIQKTHLHLSPITPPHWPQMDIGIAKAPVLTPDQLGLYYDFFRLADHRFFILMATATHPSLEAAIHIAILNGMIRAEIQPFITTTSTPFLPFSFLNQLNLLLHHDLNQTPIAIGCILLDPFNDLLTYISCGLPPLLHLPEGETKPRMLVSENDPLGIHSSMEFSQTSDNWNVSDTLLLHTLTLPEKTSVEVKTTFDETFKEAVMENALLSAPHQAEAILKKLSFNPTAYPKALISLQRIL